MRIGDKVRIKSLSEIKKTLLITPDKRIGALGCKERLCFISDMVEYCGKVDTIDDIDNHGILYFKYIPFSWCQDWVTDLTKRPRRE